MKARYFFFLSFLVCATPLFAMETATGVSDELSHPFTPHIHRFKERQDLGFIHITDRKTLKWAQQNTSHFDNPDASSEEDFLFSNELPLPTEEIIEAEGEVLKEYPVAGMRIITQNGHPIGDLRLKTIPISGSYVHSSVSIWFAKQHRGKGMGTLVLKEIFDKLAVFVKKKIGYIYEDNYKRKIFKGLSAFVELGNYASLKANFNAGGRIKDYEIKRPPTGGIVAAVTFAYPPTAPEERPFMPQLKKIEGKITDSNPEINEQGWAEYKAFVSERLKD